VSFANIASAQTEFTISTSGATALGAFTRMNSNANSPTLSTIVRGPLAVGGRSTIGSTSYTLNPGVTYLGIADPSNAPITGEPTTSMDRLLYYYRESGSVQGDPRPGRQQRAAHVAAGRGDPPDRSGRQRVPVGERQPVQLDGVGLLIRDESEYGRGHAQHRARERAKTTPAGRCCRGRRLTVSRRSASRGRTCCSSRRSRVSGTPGVNATPLSAGYGLGRGNIGNTNFQQLRNQTSIVGGIAPATTRLRNQDVAVVPFNLVANPGTGLAEVSKEQGNWLQATGRLPNGANFNSVTREFGSGTRNQGALNLGSGPVLGIRRARSHRHRQLHHDR
jgi:hypothetical protein